MAAVAGLLEFRWKFCLKFGEFQNFVRRPWRAFVRRNFGCGGQDRKHELGARVGFRALETRYGSEVMVGS